MSVWRETKITRFWTRAIGSASLLMAIAFAAVPLPAAASAGFKGPCSGCHVMEDQNRAFAHSGAHRRVNCVACHLPNDNAVSHYFWKGIDGMKDVLFFYSGNVPEKITLSQHGEKVVQGNCIRCHGETVSMMNTERKCWSCHRSISHTRAGSIQTL